MKNIGILAFGSLRNNPGEEIEPCIIERRNVSTPFPVEFSRISEYRKNAPTLVPVPHGHSITAEILVLADHISLEQAQNMVYRREIDKVGSGRLYKEVPNPGPKKVLIKASTDFSDIDRVLYVDFPEAGKRLDLTANDLAKFAIESVRANDQNSGKDGITYLIDAKAGGIKTALQAEYEREILRQVGASNLEQAMKLVMQEK